MAQMLQKLHLSQPLSLFLTKRGANKLAEPSVAHMEVLSRVDAIGDYGEGRWRQEGTVA